MTSSPLTFSIAAIRQKQHTMSNASVWRACRRCRASPRLIVGRRIQVNSILSFSGALEPNFAVNKRIFSTSSVPSDAPRPLPPTIKTFKSLDDFNDEIQQWMQVPVGQWTTIEVARGYYLMEASLKYGSNQGMHIATRVFKRWIQKGQKRKHVLSNSRQLLEYLHRVLHGWKLHGFKKDQPGRIGVLLLNDLEKHFVNTKVCHYLTFQVIRHIPWFFNCWQRL